MVAVTKYHRLMDFNNRNLLFIFSQLWNLEVQDQDVSRVGILRGFSPWVADGCLLALSSRGKERERERERESQIWYPFP
jgi:hypothetical protein